MSFRTALAADFKRIYKKNRILLEAKTTNRRCSSLASGGVADTGNVSMLFGDEGDGEAACGPGKPSLVLDETERLPHSRITVPLENYRTTSELAYQLECLRINFFKCCLTVGSFETFFFFS